MATLLLLLAACERDPTLIGYWDIAAMRAGYDADALDEVTLAGTVEFKDHGCTAVYAYTWENGGWTPDPQPVALEYATDHAGYVDFFESYKSEGETYTVAITSSTQQIDTFDIVDWAGSTVTFASKKALPPGPWETYYETGSEGQRMIVEMDLER